MFLVKKNTGVCETLCPDGNKSEKAIFAQSHGHKVTDIGHYHKLSMHFEYKDSISRVQKILRSGALNPM